MTCQAPNQYPDTSFSSLPLSLNENFPHQTSIYLSLISVLRYLQPCGGGDFLDGSLTRHRIEATSVGDDADVVSETLLHERLPHFVHKVRDKPSPYLERLQERTNCQYVFANQQTDRILLLDSRQDAHRDWERARERDRRLERQREAKRECV